MLTVLGTVDTTGRHETKKSKGLVRKAKHKTKSGISSSYSSSYSTAHFFPVDRSCVCLR